MDKQTAGTVAPEKKAKPSRDIIRPRRMDFDFSADIPRFWFDNDIFKTLLMTAQSCTFPEGERFFIDSVRHYQPQITDPVLQAQVRGFIGQEAHHGKEHTTLNDFMAARGFATEAVQSHVRTNLQLLRKRMSAERQLAMTCALEHFTAMLAELALEHPDFFKGMDERVRVLWLWHAIEESEHKSVAFDVYQQTVGSRWVRNSEMVVNTLTFFFFSAVHFNTLYKACPEKIGVRGFVDGFGFLFGRQGWLRKLTPRYLAYFKADFHPSKVDSTLLRRRVMNELERLTQNPAFAAMGSTR